MTKYFDHNNYPQIFIRLKPSVILPGEIGAFAMKDFEVDEVVVDGSLFQDDNIMMVEEYNLLDVDRHSLLKAHSTITQDKLFIPSDLNYLRTINYFNHSCEANIGFDVNDNYVAMKKISKGDEFLLDYSLLNTNPEYKLDCRCGSKNCRKIVTGNEWKNQLFVTKYKKYFASTLREQISKSN